MKKVAKPVARISKRVKNRIKNMTDTLYGESNGIGLAAPQIGISERLVVIDLVDEDGLRIMINPVIVRKEGSVQRCEGCLSVPDFEGDVERFATVECQYITPEGKKEIVNAEGLLAVCIQHELDHLDGILFIDRATSIMPKAKEVE